MPQPYVSTTVRLTPEEYEQVALIARRMGISKSALLHAWVRAKIDEARTAIAKAKGDS